MAIKPECTKIPVLPTDFRSKTFLRAKQIAKGTQEQLIK
jgi:hypothetical protein